MPMIPSGTPIHLFEDTLICIERAMLVWCCFKHCSLLLLRQRKTKSLFQEWRTNSTSNWNMAWSGVICPWLKAWTKSWNCCAVGTRSKVNLSTGAIKHCGSPKVAGFWLSNNALQKTWPTMTAWGSWLRLPKVSMTCHRWFGASNRANWKTFPHIIRMCCKRLEKIDGQDAPTTGHLQQWNESRAFPSRAGLKTLPRGKNINWDGSSSRYAPGCHQKQRVSTWQLPKKILSEPQVAWARNCNRN